MPVIYNYPQASFKKCIEVSEAVDALGGSCSVEMCATKLGKQHTSGGYRVLLAGTVKFGLVENKKGGLTITELYKNIKLAYSSDEKRGYLLQAFLKPSVFKSLYDRFKERELPTTLLPKMLVREFGVDEDSASRVSGYFIEGLKDFGILDASGKINSLKDETETSAQHAVSSDEEADNIQNKSIIKSNYNDDSFMIIIEGPGLNHSFVIKDEEDFEMVDILLRKIKKALKAKETKSETVHQ